jgi:hypothetical protein
LKIAVIIFAIVLAGEVSIRFCIPFVSGSVRHIKEIPILAEQLSESKGVRILILGNSMINNGIHVNVIRKEIEKIGGTISNVVKINPDGTDLWDWYFLYKNYFLVLPNPPDMVVVGFRSDFVEDQRRPNPSRLAANFSGILELSELIAFGMKSSGEIAEYLVASSFCLFAHREAIRNRAMDMFIPYYKDIIVKLRTAEWKAPSLALDVAKGDHSYRRLATFISLVQSKGGMVILVALPIRNNYIIKNELLLTADEGGAVLLDLRSVRGLHQTHFIDAVHLNTAGAEILSRQLAKNLTPLLPTTGSEH